MKKYFIEYSCGAGMTGYEVDSFNTDDDANEHARSQAIDWAQLFGYEQDEDYFGEMDSVGLDWNEDDECYEQEGFLEYDVVEYDPEEHDSYLH